MRTGTEHWVIEHEELEEAVDLIEDPEEMGEEDDEAMMVMFGFVELVGVG